MLIVDLGCEDGLAIGDRAVCSDGRQVRAAGKVFYLEQHKSAVRFAAFDRQPAPGMDAVVVPAGFGDQLAGGPPRPPYRSADVQSVLPGGDRVWTTAGSAHGWRRRDPVLLSRDGQVVAAGRIVDLIEGASLVRLDGSSGLLHRPRCGDIVEAIGTRADDRPGRTRLIGVRAIGGVDILTLAGDERLGCEIGDRLDVFRRGEYVAFATLSDVTPRPRAVTVASFQCLPAAPGDEVLFRLAPDMPGRRAGRVFRRERDYCLVTLGEADGLVRGQPLTAVSTNGLPVQLKVKALYPDHCGAQIADQVLADVDDLPLWTEVSTMPRALDAPAAGNTALPRPARESVSGLASWLYELSPPPGHTYEWGQLVSIAGESRRVGVIVASFGDIAWAVRLDGWRR